MKNELKHITEDQFKSLCSLLEDQSGKTFSALSRNFKALIRQEPKWRQWLEMNGHLSANFKIRQLLDEIQWEDLEIAVKNLMAEGIESLDLEEGLYILSNFSDHVTRYSISAPLDRWAKELSDLIHGIRESESLIKVFNQYVFEQLGFHGNHTNYYDPGNSYLHKVLQTKSGIPISLSAVCLLLAKRVEWHAKPLPLAGVGLPLHFIVQFRFPEKNVFVDPFNRGKILTRKDCLVFLKNNDIEFKESHLSPVGSHAILCRTITNLLHIYSNLGEEKKRNQLLRYLHILNGEELHAD